MGQGMIALRFDSDSATNFLSPPEHMNTPSPATDSTRQVPLRPRTRGELRDALNAGSPCEVQDVGVEMTTIMLKHWLNCRNFTVEKSPNDGWVLFTPSAQPDGALHRAA